MPKMISLDVPSESAIFQHSPTPDSRLRTEWEPGCQPDEVYDRILPSWRAWLRRYLVGRLRSEKVWMAEWQGRIRTELGDLYFYWTAVFGSEGLTFWVSVELIARNVAHTFFMTFLPLFFFFGYPLKGRG